MSVTRYVNGDPSIGQDLPDSQKCALTQQPWGHTPACPWRTIQFGVDQLAKIGGGILTVVPYRYVENVVMDGKAYSHISIVGDAPASTTASSEIIEPAQVGFCSERPLVEAKDTTKPTILIKGGNDDIRLENLNVTNGNHGIDATGVRKLQVIACCIDNNTALKEGGGGFVFGGCRDVLVRGCFVFANSAMNQGAVGGGGAITSCEKITVEGCHFHANQADLAGGALRVDNCPQSSRVNIEDSVFGDPANKARYGGGISIDFCHGVDIRVGMLKANQHVANEAQVSGGAIAIEMSTCKIGQDQFSRNRAGSHGGALFVHNGFGVRLAGTTFEENRALAGSGGAIHAEGDDSSGRLTLSAVTLRGNTAENGFGGGLHARFDVTVRILANTFFVSNQARSGGGLFYSGGSHARDLEIAGTKFDLNQADDSGGGAFVSEAQATIKDDMRFDSNTAGDQGGGLCFKGDGQPSSALDLDGCKFIQNQALRGGGAFIAEAYSGAITANIVRLNHGGFYFLQDRMAALGIKNNRFQSNTTQAGALEDLVADGDAGTPKLTQADLVAANSVPSAGVVVK